MVGRSFEAELRRAVEGVVDAREGSEDVRWEVGEEGEDAEGEGGMCVGLAPMSVSRLGEGTAELFAEGGCEVRDMERSASAEAFSRMRTSLWGRKMR